MKIINFTNRDGYKVWAEEIEPCRWLVKHNLPEWATWRIIGETNNIVAIDPMGGPMISVGGLIDEETIVKIENTKEGWLLKTK